MSQQQYIRALYDQLARINLIIDRKIMIGKSYKLEAKRHKAILMKIRKYKNPGLFDRISSVFSHA
jgi:hypothetical protein